ncbi:MAG: arginase [Planctomycetes bacterium]|nr:arginase [Planctomycetota bacterium]
MPLDHGASRRGTDMGPSALRSAGLGKALERLGWDVEREEDIPVAAMETQAASAEHELKHYELILAACRDLAGRVRRVLEQNQIPLVLGGDHSIAMGTISGMASYVRAQGQELGLIWFDAHGDMNTPLSSPTGNIHGMPLSHMLGVEGVDASLAGIGGPAPMVKPENVALVGIRDIDEAERAIIQDSGIRAFTMSEIDRRGMAAVAAEALEVVTSDTAGFHVSFDVDGCDPSVIPGSGTLVPGGVSYREAHYLLEECAATEKMLAMEVVELNPLLDQGNISAERARDLILSAFGKRIL